MSTFGENLRREREMRGVTLHEISDATKISVRALKAVEEDQFEKLPGGIFTRSFVRAYVKYLGLDEERIMADFQLVAPSSAQQADLTKMSQQRTPPRKKSRGAWVALVVAVLMLGGGFAYYRLFPHAKKSPLPAAQSPAQGLDSTSGQTQAAPKASPAPGSEAASPEDGLVLQIAATEESWVAVSTDGKNSSQQLMEPNQIETFHAKESFDILTGNAEGVILTLNGKTLDPLGRRGETKRLHLTLADAQNSNP